MILQTVYVYCVYVPWYAVNSDKITPQGYTWTSCGKNRYHGQVHVYMCIRYKARYQGGTLANQRAAHYYCNSIIYWYEYHVGSVFPAVHM